MREFLLRLATPLGRLFHNLTFLVALYCLYLSAYLGYNPLLWQLMVALSILALVGLWVVRLLLFVGLTVFLDKDYPRLKAVWNWGVLPATALLTFLLIQHQIPFRVAFRLSLPAMTRLAQKVERTKTDTRFPDQTVGFYHATHIVKTADSVYFSVGERDDILSTSYLGFSYAPNTQSPAEPALPYQQAMIYVRLNPQWFYSESIPD